MPFSVIAFSSTCIITSVLNLGFILFILLNRSRAAKLAPVYLWAAFCLSASVWSLGLGMQHLINNPAISYRWAQVEYIGAVFIPTFFVNL